MPFGIKSGKDKDKKPDPEEEKTRSSLFGNRKAKLPAPPAANPYAAQSPSQDPYGSRAPATNPYATQAPGNDPYARPQQTRSQPPTGSFGNLSLNEKGAPPAYQQSGPPLLNRNESSPAKTPIAGNSGRPGNGGGGYASSDPYSTTNSYGGSSLLAPRSGGYGGLKRTPSTETTSTDAGRNALFGAAPQRAQQQTSAQAGQSGQPQDSSYSNITGHGSDDMPGGYGYGEQRELTEQELEDQEVDAIKDQTKEIRKDTAARTANARRIAEQAQQTGNETLQRLGAQGERLFNTERNLNLAQNHNVLAAEKARELKTLNRSMFAVHVDNPFTAKKREEAAINLAAERRREEREAAGATQAQAYASQAKLAEHRRNLRGMPNAPKQRDLEARKKYLFDADDEDEELEDQIEDDMNIILQGARALNGQSKAIGQVLEDQNKKLDQLAVQTDKVDQGIAQNRARLDRIR